MARSITITSISNTTGEVTFDVTGATPAKMNQTYKVSGLVTSSKDELMLGIRTYLRQYREGLAAERRNPPTEVTALVNTAQTDNEE